VKSPRRRGDMVQSGVSTPKANLMRGPSMGEWLGFIKLFLATRLWRIQRWYLAGSENGPLHRVPARTSSDTNLSRKYIAFLKKHGAHLRQEIPLGCLGYCARSYRTLRDGSLGGRFSRHFVPGYYRTVPPGQKPSGRRSASHYPSAYGLNTRT
jgi:hypothetical protein